MLNLITWAYNKKGFCNDFGEVPRPLFIAVPSHDLCFQFWSSETCGNFKRYAQVLPSPNDTGMHRHAHIGHARAAVRGALGPGAPPRLQRRRGGANGQVGRGDANSLSASQPRAVWMCERPGMPAAAQHRPHGARQARRCHAHNVMRVSPVPIRVAIRPCAALAHGRWECM